MCREPLNRGRRCSSGPLQVTVRFPAAPAAPSTAEVSPPARIRFSAISSASIGQNSNGRGCSTPGKTGGGTTGPSAATASGPHPARGPPPGSLVFVHLPTPTDQEFADLATRLTDRLTILVQRQFKRAEEGLLRTDPATLPLRASTAESIRVPGMPKRTFGESREQKPTPPPDKPLCCRINGFSLHAARTVEPSDRAGLERLARYCLRAPYSLDRLSLTPEGLGR